MAFSWVNNPSNITLIDDNVYVEMRNNLDSIKDYVDCNQNYITDYATNDQTEYNGNDFGNQSAQDTGEKIGDKNTERTSLNGGDDNTVLNGNKSGEYSNDNLPHNVADNSNIETGEDNGEKNSENSSKLLDRYGYANSQNVSLTFSNKHDSLTGNGYGTYHDGYDSNAHNQDKIQIHGAQKSDDQSSDNTFNCSAN